MAETRIERDTMEEMAVTSDRCWGAQTQISLNKTLACSPMNIAHDVDGFDGALYCRHRVQRRAHR